MSTKLLKNVEKKKTYLMQDLTGKVIPLETLKNNALLHKSSPVSGIVELL